MTAADKIKLHKHLQNYFTNEQWAAINGQTTMTYELYASIMGRCGDSHSHDLDLIFDWLYEACEEYGHRYMDFVEQELAKDDDLLFLLQNNCS